MKFYHEKSLFKRFEILISNRFRLQIFAQSRKKDTINNLVLSNNKLWFRQTESKRTKQGAIFWQFFYVVNRYFLIKGLSMIAIRGGSQRSCDDSNRKRSDLGSTFS